jgi:hypothetical protein
MHHLLANQIAKMANPNQVGNTKRIRTKRSIIVLRANQMLTEIKWPIETKRIRSKGSFIFLQIKLPKWQIQIRLATKAKENAIGIGKSNCQNDKSKLHCQQRQRKMLQ